MTKTYIYANSQIIMQHSGAPATNNKSFYLHDRLGSVREMIDTDGNVVRFYTYNPFGEAIESGYKSQAPDNCFMFTGQYFDTEIGQYYLRARQYDPYISRFTSRDPVDGKFEEPMSFHKYLYCFNNPINLTDPWGLDAYLFFNPKGGPTGWPRLGHVSVGVDNYSKELPNQVILRSAAWGGLDPIYPGTSFEDAMGYGTGGENMYITFKNKGYNARVSSDFRVRSYLHKSFRPYWDTTLPYCSTYSKAALAYGGYDMGMEAGATPWALMVVAIGRWIEGDENIEVSKNALYWYLTETDWLGPKKFTEAWLNGE